MVYAYLPFMILPLYTQLVKLDNRLLESRFRLGRRSDQILLYHYPAFIQNRHYCRLYAGLRASRRRICDS